MSSDPLDTGRSHQATARSGSVRAVADIVRATAT